MSISYSYKEKPVQDLHGNLAVEGENDFPSKKALKKAIKQRFADFSCPECGGHRIDGDYVRVEIGKVRFYREKMKKGWFSRKKPVEVHVKDVYRLYDITLDSGLAGLFKGYISCKACGWKIKGGDGSSTSWLSINDIANGRF